MIAASAGASAYGVSLKTCQTRPEQSKPPCAWTPKSDCCDGLVPPQTYGKPTYETAVLSTSCCHAVDRSGAANSSVDCSTESWSSTSNASARATEYAASARVIGWSGSCSSASSAAGWLKRSPSSRATVSVPTRAGGERPASRRATRIFVAAVVRPSAPTRTRSNCVTVTEVVGLGAFHFDAVHGSGVGGAAVVVVVVPV